MSWFRRLFNRGAPTEVKSEAGLPANWQRTLSHCVPHYRFLSPVLRERLHGLVEQFVAEKEFWGNRDLVVIPEMKVIVAAQACILVLNVPRLGLYSETKEVILYPKDFGETLEAIGPDGRIYKIDMTRIGEASRRGPVLLAWEHVKQSAQDRLDGRNVVFHEFAHALDYLNGAADGAPPLEREEDFAEWSRILGAEHRSLMAAASMGRRTLLDPYGAENPAEFFAVATESFFEDGRRLKRNHPALYGQLRRFYQQETAEWGHW
ncbi:MAG: M90 family metallopeptidase [Planctomycetota bacterium]